MMQVFMNDTAVEVDEADTIYSALKRLEYPDQGVALALNAVIVPQKEWHCTPLKAADRLAVFQIISGG
jgi:sulfur carrier protein